MSKWAAHFASTGSILHEGASWLQKQMQGMAPPRGQNGGVRRSLDEGGRKRDGRSIPSGFIRCRTFVGNRAGVMVKDHASVEVDVPGSVTYLNRPPLFEYGSNKGYQKDMWLKEIRTTHQTP